MYHIRVDVFESIAHIMEIVKQFKKIHFNNKCIIVFHIVRTE